MNSFNFIVSSTSTCGEKSDKFLYLKITNFINEISYFLFLS
ncbi:hypothetical protein [Spiroplasma ixodetis]|nr:hypothetical protein [Spiroplasma ixodetis]